MRREMNVSLPGLLPKNKDEQGREGPSFVLPIDNTWRHWWRKEPFLSGAVFQWRGSSASSLNTKTDTSDEPQKHTVFQVSCKLVATIHGNHVALGGAGSWVVRSFTIHLFIIFWRCQVSPTPCFSAWSKAHTKMLISHPTLYAGCGRLCITPQLNWYYNTRILKAGKLRAQNNIILNLPLHLLHGEMHPGFPKNLEIRKGYIFM